MDSREMSRLPTSESPGAPNSYSGGSVPSSPMMTPNLVGMMPTNMNLSFNPMPPSVSKPMESHGSLYYEDGAQVNWPSGNMLSMGETMKRKRGRPRKYMPDGNMSLALSVLSPASASGYLSSPMSEQYAKRRGRPLGSGKKKQLDALGSAGTAFTPHIITVKAGEDVASKIMAFSQQGPRTICILSANGAISNVTLRQPATSGGTVSYEGRFEIISLSGSFLLIDSGVTRSRTGGLSVALAGSDGRVLGGGVAGMLMAATPVQVIVGSFIADGKKPKPEPSKLEPFSAPPRVPNFGGAFSFSPPSQGASSETSDDSGRPMNPSSGTCNNSSQHVQSMPLYASVSWSHSESAPA